MAVVPENKQTLLRSVIASHFQPLLDRYGFREESYEGNDLYYSTETLIQRSSTFLLRFTTDRGCLGIDIRPTTDPGWIDLGFFLEFLGHPLDFAGRGAVYAEESGPSFARALDAHYETIIDLLERKTLDQTWIRFRAFMNLRTRRLFGVQE
jgi:hypothetical protein